jgi:hypothetical protein
MAHFQDQACELFLEFLFFVMVSLDRDLLLQLHDFAVVHVIIEFVNMDAVQQIVDILVIAQLRLNNIFFVPLITD